MNRWRRKRRVSARTSPRVNQESLEKKVVKKIEKNGGLTLAINKELLQINEEEIRHLAKNDPDYRE